ncbi:MAG: hypothetical protein AAF468_22270 [Pseudomonadota bacterium]
MSAPISNQEPFVVDADEVGALLNIQGDTFRNKRRALEQNGFPPKLPGLNGWSRPAIIRWIETNGGTYLPADPQPFASNDPLASFYEDAAE